MTQEKSSKIKQTIDNGATIIAENGGILEINATINGGSIAANGGNAIIQGTFNQVTLSSGPSHEITMNSSTLNRVTNNAKINANNSFTIQGGFFHNSGTVFHSTSNKTITLDTQTDISGSGKLTLNFTRINGNNLTQGASHTLDGTGIITSDFTNHGTIMPGNSIGSITVQGTTTLSSTSRIILDITGSTPSSSNDLFASTGTINLDGNLFLRFSSGINPLNANETITIIDGGTLSGTFNNIANGQRLYTNDNSASFIVNYGPDSPFDSNKVVLSQAELTPSPIIDQFIINVSPTPEGGTNKTADITISNGISGWTANLQASTDLGQTEQWKVIASRIFNSSGKVNFSNITISRPESEAGGKDFFRIAIEP